MEKSVKNIWLSAALLTVLAACATKPLELPSETVLDATYNANTCAEILADRERLEALHAEELSYLPSEGWLANRWRDVQFSFTKIFDKDADKEYRRRLQRYERIKGEYESAERVAKRRCGYGTANEGEVIEKAPAETPSIEDDFIEDLPEEETPEEPVIQEPAADTV